MTDPSNLWLTLVAARESAGVVWGRFDHQRPRFGNAELAVIVGATTLFIVVMFVSYLRSRRRKLEFLQNSSSRLFRELSTAHQLNRSNRRLIKRLAAANGQNNAAALFVEPDYFEPERTAALASVAPQVLRQLRDELFE